jgi:phage-related protein
MADDTTKGLAAITAQLVGTNDKLDGLLTAAQGNLSPAELKAKNQDDDASTNKSNSLLEKIGIGIGNMYESTKKAAKVALKGAGAALIGLALGAATYALGEFLQSDTFKKILKYIKEEVIPGLEKFWDFLKDNWGKIAIALIAIKLFMMSTLLPTIIAALAPLAPFILIGVAIAAAIALVIGGLMAAFDDFQKTLEETGSITEALKVGVAKFMGFILGFIPGLVLDLVSWVAGLFGFDDFAKQVDSIDPIQFIADTFKGLFDTIEAWVMELFKDPLGAIVDYLLAPLNIFLNFSEFIYGKAIKPLIDWVGELFGVSDASGQMEVYIGEKLDNIINFAGAIYDKYIKPIVDWVSNLFNSTVSSVKESPAGKMIGKAMDMAKNFIKTALRAILPDPSGGWTSVEGVAAKAIPKFVYEYAGMNPDTGEIIKPPPIEGELNKPIKIIKPSPPIEGELNKPIDTSDTSGGYGERVAKFAREKAAREAAAAAGAGGGQNIAAVDAKQTTHINMVGNTGQYPTTNRMYGVPSWRQ